MWTVCRRLLVVAAPPVVLAAGAAAPPVLAAGMPAASPAVPAASAALGRLSRLAPGLVRLGRGAGHADAPTEAALGPPEPGVALVRPPLLGGGLGGPADRGVRVPSERAPVSSTPTATATREVETPAARHAVPRVDRPRARSGDGRQVRREPAHLGRDPDPAPAPPVGAVGLGPPAWWNAAAPLGERKARGGRRDRREESPPPPHFDSGSLRRRPLHYFSTTRVTLPTVWL